MIWLPLLAMPTLADPTEADQQVGVWGGVIVLALAVGTFLLWLNMRKQLRKIDVPGDVAGDQTGESDAEVASEEGQPEDAQPKEDPAE